MATTVLGSQNRLHYKGYTGSVFFSVEDDCLHGRILDIDDLITYEGETVGEIKRSFRYEVDRYISFRKSYAVKQRHPDGSVEIALIEPDSTEKG